MISAPVLMSGLCGLPVIDDAMIAFVFLLIYG